MKKNCSLNTFTNTQIYTMTVEIHYVFDNDGISIFAISEKGKVKDAQYDETNCLFMGSRNECFQYCKDNNLVIG